MLVAIFRAVYVALVASWTPPPKRENVRVRVPAGMVGPAKPEPEDPSPLLPDDATDEVLLVARHRTIGLLDLGFDLDQTLRLVHLADVVHTCADLRKRGWPHEWIVDTLAPDDVE